MPRRGSKEYQEVYALLIQAAKFRGTVTYQDLAECMGLPNSGQGVAAAIGAVLNEIAAEEVSVGRPMLPAVAVGARNSPGDGFYRTAIKLGRLSRDASTAERRQFWEQELRETYQTWRG
jgi:hypothetical protein